MGKPVNKCTGKKFPCGADAFETWVLNLLPFEGGVANHPNDYGGLTNKGVTIKLFAALAPKVLGIEGSAANLLKLTDDQAVKIARWHWDQIDSIEIDAIAILAAEGVWGSGHNRPIQWAMQSLGVPLIADGVLGPISIAAINNFLDPVKLYDAIAAQRIQFYHDIVKNDPSQKVFLTGWLRRVNDMNEMAKLYFPPKKKVTCSCT